MKQIMIKAVVIILMCSVYNCYSQDYRHKGDTTVCRVGAWNDVVTYKSIEWDGYFLFCLGVNNTDYYLLRRDILESYNIGDTVNIDALCELNGYTYMLNDFYEKRRHNGGYKVEAIQGNY
jgi:hypothetical protein